MGAVFVATDERDGTRVAIKVVHAHVSAKRSARDRFVREAQAGQSVTHPNVVRTIALESVEDPDGTRDALVLETEFTPKTLKFEHLSCDIQPGGDKKSTQLFLDVRFDKMLARCLIELPAK